MIRWTITFSTITGQPTDMIYINIVNKITNETIDTSNLESCPPFAVGQRLTVDIEVKQPEVWDDDVKPHSGNYFIKEIEHYSRKHYAHRKFEYWSITLYVEPCT